MKTLYQKILFLPHLFFPELCPHCKSEFITDSQPLCSDCMQRLRAVCHEWRTCTVCLEPLDKNGVCAWCSERGVFFNRHFNLFNYHAQAKKILLIAKFENRKKSVRFLIHEGRQKIDEIVQRHNIQHVVYLPSSKKLVYRLRSSRGVQTHADIFYKQNDSKNKELNRLHRFRSIESSLQAHVEKISRLSPHNILLVDDVWTTGATANRAAKLLVEAGIAKKSIYVFTLMQRAQRKRVRAEGKTNINFADDSLPFAA